MCVLATRARVPGCAHVTREGDASCCEGERLRGRDSKPLTWLSSIVDRYQAACLPACALRPRMVMSEVVTGCYRELLSRKVGEQGRLVSRRARTLLNETSAPHATWLTPSCTLSVTASVYYHALCYGLPRRGPCGPCSAHVSSPPFFVVTEFVQEASMCGIRCIRQDSIHHT